MTDLADDSAFLVLNKNSGTLYPISSDVRALLISEMLRTVKLSSEKVISILNSKTSKLQHSLDQDEHLILRNFMASCQNLVYMSYYVKGIKTEQNSRGELHPTKIIKVLGRIYESLSNEAMSIHQDYCNQIQNILSYFIRLNFLFAANQKAISKFSETYNLENPTKAKNLHEVTLKDFPGFRSKFPMKEPEYKPAKLLLKKRQTNNDFEKSVLHLDQPGKGGRKNNPDQPSYYQYSASSSSDENSDEEEEQDDGEEEDDHSGDDYDGGEMMDDMVEIHFENEGDMDNLSLGNNRLIIVRENHSFIDPIENDPILSSHISVGNNLAIEDWDSQFDDEIEEEEDHEGSEEEYSSDENHMDMEGSEEHFDRFGREEDEIDEEDQDGEEEDHYVEEGDENPLVGIERIVPTIRNMIPDDQFEQYLDQLQEDLNLEEEALDLQHERDLIRHLDGENLMDTGYDDQEEHNRFGRSVNKHHELHDAAKAAKPVVLDDMFRKVMNIYPYKGKIDTVGNLTITLHDSLSQYEMQNFSVDFDRMMQDFKETPVFNRMSKAIVENSRVRMLMWGIIHENLFGNVKDRKDRSHFDDGPMFDNPRWRAPAWRDQHFGEDLDGGLRFGNYDGILNRRTIELDSGLDNLSIFDFLRNDRNINSITIRRDAGSS